MPLSELPIMKALMGLASPSSAITTPERRPNEHPKMQFARLMTTIIDKLQILALRRPRALIIVAQVIDGLLKQQLDALDDVQTGEHIGVRESRHTDGSAHTKVESRP
jgi:hypothetical protein